MCINVYLLSICSLALSVEMEAEKEEPVEDIPEEATMATVPLDSLVGVLAHGQSMRGDSHRFSTATDPDDVYSKVSLALWSSLVSSITLQYSLILTIYIAY